MEKIGRLREKICVDKMLSGSGIVQATKKWYRYMSAQK
jgi:hypothetical protein